MDDVDFGLLMEVLRLIAFIFLPIFLIYLISYWKIFTKAGKPGWFAIIPIYSQIVLAEIAGQPWWYGLLVLCVFLSPIPYVGRLLNVVGYVFPVIIKYYLAFAFGKNTNFAIGLVFLPFIFLPILAFSKDTHYTLNQSTQGQNY